jgi:hypothetical protein
VRFNESTHKHICLENDCPIISSSESIHLALLYMSTYYIDPPPEPSQLNLEIIIINVVVFVYVFGGIGV